MPFGRRTTTVPAILSCQPFFSGSNAIQRKPRPMTMRERKQASARTAAVTQSIGLPSARTTFSPNTIPPIVEPLYLQRTAPYAAIAGMNRKATWKMIATRITSITSAAMRIQNPALANPASETGGTGRGAGGTAAGTTGANGGATAAAGGASGETTGGTGPAGAASTGGGTAPGADDTTAAGTAASCATAAGGGAAGGAAGAWAGAAGGVPAGAAGLVDVKSVVSAQAKPRKVTRVQIIRPRIGMKHSAIKRATPTMSASAGCLSLPTIVRPTNEYRAALPKTMQAMTESGRTTRATGIPTMVTRSRMKSTGIPRIARIPVRNTMPGRCSIVSAHFLIPPGNRTARSR